MRIAQFAAGSGLILALLGPAIPAGAESCGTPLAESATLPEPRQLVVARERTANKEKASYYRGLLREVLAITESEYGPCELISLPYVLTRARMTQTVHRGQGLEVLWANATPEREARMRAIPMPIFRGLMSYKVALIRSEDQARFSAVESLDELREFTIGVGLDWPDAQIMRANGLRVVGTNNYDSLAKMLAAGRFDMMLRSVSEVDTELNVYADLNFAAAQELLVVFPSPVYFFVQPDDHQLAGRLELGLRRMENNGSFDEYFYRHASAINVFDYVNLEDRRIIYLDNPLLPEGTPLTRKEYGLFPWKQDSQGRWRIDTEKFRRLQEE